MTLFRSTFHNTVTDPIPTGTSSKSIIALLHDHAFLITQSPIVTKYNESSHDPVSGKVTYDVWESLSLLPFGWWKYEIQFKASFKDKADGLVSEVEAPLGFHSKADYTIRLAEDGQLELIEAIESSCMTLFRPFVEMTMVPVRRKMHARIIAKAQKMEQGAQEQKYGLSS